MQQAGKHEHWSSKWLFILAAVGSSVGLANIWRFPYTAGENGGGIFVLIYLASVFFLALPLVIGEFMLGRRGQTCPTESLKKIAAESGARPAWVLIGFMGIFSASLILSFYSMIGGETIIYAFHTLTGKFSNIDAQGAAGIADEFNASWLTVLGGHTLFMGITIYISANGISGGLEKAVKYMMPLLFLILIIMVGYAAVTGDFITSLKYLFTPDMQEISANAQRAGHDVQREIYAVAIDAFGQAFFSVSVGATTLMAYGSYLRREESIADAATMIVSADTLVALLAGLAIFPLVFVHNLDPTGGPGLVFVSVPLAFGSMPGGLLIGTGFFVLLAFAAITSSISMLEVPVAWLAEKDNWTRRKAALVSGGVIWVIGLLSVLSLNQLSGFQPLDWAGVSGTFFDLFDYLTSNIMLPITGILTALFIGYVVPESVSCDELQILRDHHWFKIWLFILRTVVPLVLLLVFYNLVF
jgi:NSS family neurotransmitter:Na+ symporter